MDAFDTPPPLTCVDPSVLLSWTNLNIAMGPGPGDYPPLSTNVVKSTSPLIPANYASSTPGSFPERPTHAGLIDQITGHPLIRQVDFELPFGGTVFRHVHSYATIPTEHGVFSVAQNLSGSDFWTTTKVR